MYFARSGKFEDRALAFLPEKETIIKTSVFAFIIASVSSYFGYHAKGGAIAVGKSSTLAVVSSSIVILIFNYILTDFILS